MSVIEKLDSVLEIIGIAIESDERADQDTADESAFNLLRYYGPAIRQAMIDARRYRWLRDNCKREWESQMPDTLGHVSLDIDFEASGTDLDAAIDARLASDSEGGSDE